jgi:hypothetical protein
MKTKVILLFLICIASCAKQQEAKTNWFPDNPDQIIKYSPIYEYIYNFNTSDKDAARDAYIYLLNFIEEVINAGYENLERAHLLNSATVKRPAMINGELTIIESTDMARLITKWNDDRTEIVEIAAVEVLWESFLIISYSMQYNYLLSYWYSLTNELLGEYIDVISREKKLSQDIEPLLEPGPYFIYPDD